jgi:hypothetical protein
MYQDPRRGPSTRSEWLISAVVAIVLLGLLAAEVADNYTPAKLSALLVVLFWVPLLVLHEGGHALAAYLLGWYVGQVVIGMGKTIARFRVGTANVEVRIIPVEGFVGCVPTRIRFPRLESALIYFAGPGVELLLALAILLLVGPERLLSRSEEYWLIICQSLAVAATSQAILNLMPFAVRTSGRPLYSDGLGIILSFIWPISQYEQMIGLKFDDQKEECEEHDPADWRKRV